MTDSDLHAYIGNFNYNTPQRPAEVSKGYPAYIRHI